MTVQHAVPLTDTERAALAELVVRVLDTDHGLHTGELARLLVQPDYAVQPVMLRLRDAGRIVPSPNGWRLPADRTPIVR